jgi:hypothetical protein
MLQWYGSDGETMRKCQPGTLKACLDVAKDFGLTGVLFARYGALAGATSPSLHERPSLMQEIRDMGLAQKQSSAKKARNN